MMIYKNDSIFPEQLYPLLGDNIKRIRKQKNMTQSELGVAVGADQKYISRIETGQARPALPMYLLIANALQVSIDEFLDGVIEETSEQSVMDAVYKQFQLGQAEQDFMQTMQNAIYRYLTERE